MANEPVTQTQLWSDWPADENSAVGHFVLDNKYMTGYADGTFRPNEQVNSSRFFIIITRAKIVDAYPVMPEIPINGITVGYALKYLPGTVTTALPNEPLTNRRLAVMLYKHFTNPVNPDQGIIDKLEKWFVVTHVTWNGKTRQPRLIGHAATIVADARKYNVPIWLALGQCWRESQWFTTGLSVDYNCGWGIKDSKGKWGIVRSTHSGYTDYVSVDESIHAYFRLMSNNGMPYWALIVKYYATGNMSYIYQALDIYAPASENDTAEHHQIVATVKSWCNDKGIK